MSHTATPLALAALSPWLTLGQIEPATKTRLVLLGTAGGPRPRKTRASPSQVIFVNNAAYVIDCGNGVAIQLVRAGLPLSAVRHIFVTHHHSDDKFYKRKSQEKNSPHRRNFSCLPAPLTE